MTVCGHKWAFLNFYPKDKAKFMEESSCVTLEHILRTTKVTPSGWGSHVTHNVLGFPKVGWLLNN